MIRCTAIAGALAVFAVAAQGAPVRGLTAAPRLGPAY